MIQFDGLDAVDPPIARSTVAIGTFDGIHIGHRAIIDTAVRDARAQDRAALVFTFDRHPEEVLRPDRDPDYLTTPGQRSRLIERLDVDGLVVARFDEALAHLTPEQFVQSILMEKLGAESVVIGADFRFGRNRAGSLEFLRRYEAVRRFAVTAIEPILLDGVPVSSTRIRDRIRSGDVVEAEMLLGHPYWLLGTVVSGQRLGRTLGYPTANLQPAVQQAIPADGIYAVMAALDDGRTFSGACSIGDRPTVPGAGRSIEVFLLEFDEQIYDRTLSIRFLEKLRDEERFESLEALKEQMATDVAQTRAICDARTPDR